MEKISWNGIISEAGGKCRRLRLSLKAGGDPGGQDIQGKIARQEAPHMGPEGHPDLRLRPDKGERPIKKLQEKPDPQKDISGYFKNDKKQQGNNGEDAGPGKRQK